MIACVTGTIAAGKNFVCSILEKQGWLCIDADKVAHHAMEKASSQIAETFKAEAEKAGISLLNPDGTLNRRNLGALLFPNPELLKKQENLVYPLVIEETKKIIADNPEKNIILNAAVLYKTPELLSLCSMIIFVTAPAPLRFIRIARRDRIPSGQIISRIRAQKNLLERYRNSGKELFIINNSGSEKKLTKALRKCVPQKG